MRVALDARPLDDPGLRERGIGRYTACLLAALREEDLGELVALRDLRRPPAPERVREGYEHLLLARDARRAGADVLHSPSIDRASMRPGVPYVITLHDLVPLKQREQYLRTGLKHRLRYAAAQRAARVIVPSHPVKADGMRLLHLRPERVAVVPYAAAPAFRRVDEPRELLARLRLPERFLLWVGGLDPPDPRKGLAELVEALSRRGDGLPLVLAGRTSAEARPLGAPGRVVLAGRVSDEELAALYSAAAALVFPSMDEGYGLPPVEALACGTPVAAYAAGPLPEVLGEAKGATLVEPGDADALLDAAEALAGTSARPLARSWGEVARETWAVYEAAAGDASH